MWTRTRLALSDEGIETPKLDRFGGTPGSGGTLGLKKPGFFHDGAEERQNGGRLDP